MRRSKTMQWTELTRDEAANYLGATNLRRTPSTPSINAYTADMNAGRWRSEICPPIVIGPRGEVFDGNHRLMAFLASDLTVLPTWINRTDDVDAVLTLDTGLPRSLADQLQLRGHANARHLQAMFFCAFRWKGGDTGRDKLSRTAQVQWVESNPNAVKAGEVAHQMKPHGDAILRFQTGTVACLYDIACYAEGGDSVEEFIQGASHGSITFPILSRLQQRMADHSNPRNSFRMSPSQISYLTTRVYLAWLNDETRLEKLYATRKVLADLPGWHEWLTAMWPERVV